MQNIFIEVLNNAWNVGILIVAVLVVRLLLKKAPKSVACILWAIVGLRLLFPVDIQSVFSLLPSGKAVETVTDGTAPVVVRTGLKIMDSQVNRYIGTYSSNQAAAPQEVVTQWSEIFCFLWIAGILGMLCYLSASYLFMRRKVASSVLLEKGVRICDEITSPFLFGLWNPCIYLSSGLEQKNREYVLAHERAHLKRRDHWWKFFGFLLLAVYWFHPLCWISYYLLCKDMELACDEMVIKKKDACWRADYCQALLDCGVGKRKVIAVPVAFGEIGVKERIKCVLQYKKTKWSIVVVAILLCAGVAFCFGTKPKEKKAATVSEKKSSTVSEIPAKKPTVDVSAITGADGARLYYADANKIIFGGYFGLFVYDTKQHQYIRSVDLKSIGMNATQGDDAYTIIASADGSEVYLRPAGGTVVKEETSYTITTNDNGSEAYFYPEAKKNENGMYVYHVKEDVFTRENSYFYEKKRFLQVQDDEVSATYDVHGKTVMCGLRNAWKTIGELGYWDSNDNKVYPLFAEESLQKAEYVTPDTADDIVKAEITYEGVHYVCTDKNTLRMIQNGLQKARKTKGVTDCLLDDVMYLTKSDKSVGMVIPAMDGCNVCVMKEGSYQLKDSLSVSIYDMIRKGYFKKENAKE